MPSICICGVQFARAGQIARLRLHARESRDSRASISRPRENWHAMPERTAANRRTSRNFASEASRNAAQGLAFAS